MYRVPSKVPTSFPSPQPSLDQNISILMSNEPDRRANDSACVSNSYSKESLNPGGRVHTFSDSLDQAKQKLKAVALKKRRRAGDRLRANASQLVESSEPTSRMISRPILGNQTPLFAVNGGSELHFNLSSPAGSHVRRFKAQSHNVSPVKERNLNPLEEAKLPPLNPSSSSISKPSVLTSQPSSIFQHLAHSKDFIKLNKQVMEQTPVNKHVTKDRKKDYVKRMLNSELSKQEIQSFQRRHQPV